MESELIVGLIYSKFDQRLGPIAKVSIPSDITSEIKRLVSLKALNIFAGEKGAVPESLAVIPFTSFDLKGLTKCVRIADSSKRGGITDCAITLIFDENNDVIFYKYIKTFEGIFQEYSEKIIKLEEKKSDPSLISDEINKLYTELLNILEDLREGEILTQTVKKESDLTSSDAENKEYGFKIIVCGDPEVGKTSTVLQFTDNAFRRSYMPTIGVNVSEKRVRYKNAKIGFLIWDIGGHRRFEVMRKHFYKGAEGVVLVFDLTNKKSFENISYWHEEIKNHLKNNVPGILVGNKKDLKEQRKITKKSILRVAKKIKYDYFETSALTGENINDVFYKLGEVLYKISEEED